MEYGVQGEGNTNGRNRSLYCRKSYPPLQIDLVKMKITGAAMKVDKSYSEVFSDGSALTVAPSDRAISRNLWPSV